jgi:hypothetical protein
VIGQQPVLIGPITEQRQAIVVTHGCGKPSVNERHPVMLIRDNVARRPLALHIRDPPVAAGTVPRPPFAFGVWLAGRTDEPSVVRHDNPGVRRLPTEPLDGVGRVAPVGVDRAPLDTQNVAVVARPIAGQSGAGESLQSCIDGSLESGRLRGRSQSVAGATQWEVRSRLFRILAHVCRSGRRSCVPLTDS